MQPPEPIDPNFRIDLPAFEGPLDLLLFLIQKHELDILDLPIAFVTESYLKYLKLMETLNLDVAAEYLVMAARLAHIKSKLLLPAPPMDQDDEEEEEGDPREELIRRLLEYQKYKEVAASLGGRGLMGRDVFLRGVAAPSSDGPAPLAPTGLFKLLDAFQRVLEKNDQDMSLEITAERISIQERIAQLTDRLMSQKQCSFNDLFEGIVTRYDLVVTFLAVLEMAKMRLMRVYQAEPNAPLFVEYRVSPVDSPDPLEPSSTEQMGVALNPEQVHTDTSREGES